MLLTRLNYRPRPKTRKPRPSRLRFRGSVKSSSDGLSLWLVDLTCLHRLWGLGSRSPVPVPLPLVHPGGPLGLNLSPPAARFLAAFSSLSRMVPHLGHHGLRWVLSRVLYPQIEHRLDVFLALT